MAEPLFDFVEQILKEAENRREKEQIEVNQVKADQMLAAVGVLEGKMNEVIELVNAEVALLEQYRTNELARLEKKLSWLVFNLDGYMRATGEKTVRLPHGVMKLRKGRDRIVIESMEEFLRHPANHQLLKKIPESFQPDTSAIWEYYKRTHGALPTGCQLIPAESKFSYSTTSEEISDGANSDKTERAA